MLRKLLLALASLLCFLGITELVLRAAGVGSSPRFFADCTADGNPALTANPFFSYRFFSPPLARVASPIAVTLHKDTNTLRVIILGESAAQGDPVPAYGPPRFLQALLEQRHPGRRIEVVNAAVTAITSPIIREIADELARLQPDAVIIYMGNNEVIGPYGPVTPAFRLLPSDRLARLAVKTSGTRLYQGLSYLAATLAETRGPVQFQGVARALGHAVPHDDARLPVMRRRFADHLAAILRATHRAGAEPVVCTVAVNRRDSPPARSVHRAGMDNASRARWQEAWSRGLAAFQRAAWTDALAAFDAARADDDAYAELACRRGVCLAKLGREAEADAAFDEALRLDAFRFRTDDALNNEIRRVAGKHPVEVDALFRAQRRDDQLFVDHVHFSPEGSYLLARTWAEALESRPSLGLADGAPWASLDDVKAACLLTPQGELELAEALLARYRELPFREQYDIADRIARAERRAQEASARLAALGPDALESLYRARVEQAPGDLVAPVLWGQGLLAWNRHRLAVERLGALVAKQPFRRDLRALLAQAEASLGHPDEAARALLGTERQHGYLAARTAEHQLGRLVQNGQEDEALAYGEALLHRLRFTDYRWRVRRQVDSLRSLPAPRERAWKLLRSGSAGEAETLFRELARVRPDWPEPLYGLAVVEKVRGNPAGARASLQQALERWGAARMNYHAGLWALREGAEESAARALQQASALAHDDRALAESLTAVTTHTANAQTMGWW